MSERVQICYSCKECDREKPCFFIRVEHENCYKNRFADDVSHSQTDSTLPTMKGCEPIWEYEYTIPYER